MLVVVPVIFADHRRHPLRDLQRRARWHRHVQAAVRGRRALVGGFAARPVLHDADELPARHDEQLRPTWPCCCRWSTRRRSWAGCWGWSTCSSSGGWWCWPSGWACCIRRRTQPIAVVAHGGVRRDRCGRRYRQKSDGGGMTGKKKLLIGVGIVVILGAIAFANFKFKRVEGVTVNVEGVKARDLEAVVSASGKIQPKRSVNISADTMGRVTDLAVEEGDRIDKGQFLLQIDPRNLRSAVQRSEASMQAARSSADQLQLALESARVAVEAGRGRQPAPAGPVGARADDEGDGREGRSGPQDAPVRPPLAGAEHQDPAAPDAAGERLARERALRPEQGSHRVADQGHRHQAEHRRG